MKEISETSEQREQRTPSCSEEQAVWQSPGYVVVETALEVTAYSLATR